MNFKDFCGLNKLLDMDLLTEDTRKEILAKVDPNFIHHKENLRDLPILSPTGTLYKGTKLYKLNGKDEFEVWFRTAGATTIGHPFHDQRLIIKDLYQQVKDKKKDLITLVRDSVNMNALLLGCNCNAFKYFYAYVAGKKGVIHPRYIENIPANTNNPNRRGIICKHEDLVLSTLPFNTQKIVSDIKNLLKI